MEKLSLVHRIMLGRAFTIAMVLGNLAIIVPITVKEVLDWVARCNHVTMPAEGEEILLAFPGQGPVGVILVALGVVLEGRHTFLRKVLKLYHLEHLPGQEAFCDACELFGFYLLVLGLVIESFSELIKFIGASNHLALLVFGAASVALNVLAIAFLLQLTVLVARMQLREPLAALPTKESPRE